MSEAVEVRVESIMQGRRFILGGVWVPTVNSECLQIPLENHGDNG